MSDKASTGTACCTHIRNTNHTETLDDVFTKLGDTTSDRGKWSEVLMVLPNFLADPALRQEFLWKGGFVLLLGKLSSLVDVDIASDILGILHQNLKDEKVRKCHSM